MNAYARTILHQIHCYEMRGMAQVLNSTRLDGGGDGYAE